MMRLGFSVGHDVLLRWRIELFAFSNFLLCITTRRCVRFRPFILFEAPISKLFWEREMNDASNSFLLGDLDPGDLQFN